MRTNIIIDDQLMREALETTGLPTKKAVVEEALRLLINIHKQSSIRSLRGKIQWEGNLDEQRQARFSAE
jgi:Arc/MetJ family transcription regulator